MSSDPADFKRGDVAAWLSVNEGDRWIGVCIGKNKLGLSIFLWRHVSTGSWARATITATDYGYLHNLGPMPGEAEWDVKFAA